MSQFAKPVGFFGRLLARCMAFGHRDFYRNTARMLDLKKDDKYLEIGFGSGIFIKKYVSNVAKISGIDYSEDMVTLASAVNSALVKSGKADFRHGNAASLPWRDNEFTAVAAIETFFFWSEPDKALQEIFRVLASKGRLVIEMSYNHDDGLDHSKDIEKMKLKLYSSKAITDMVMNAGFVDSTISHFKGLWLPFRGHLVPKGMVLRAIRR